MQFKCSKKVQKQNMMYGKWKQMLVNTDPCNPKFTHCTPGA